MTAAFNDYKVHGLFVGINKHEDQNISELGGCTRDAQALSALFRDSIENCYSELLLDDQATKGKIEECLQRIGSEATSEDVVVVSFAGHGTNTHRFVCFDTSADDVPASTVGMEAIAELFKNCDARVIMVLLDCCFSGGAAARVWDTGVTTRSTGLQLSEIAGNGRIVLTASRADEEAAEDSVRRHGLFTSRLIDLFTSEAASENPLAMFGELQNQVRVAAQRIGHDQNPRFLGEVDPSFRLPRLIKGESYFEYFPEIRIPQLTGSVDELLEASIPDGVVQAWRQRFSTLNSMQIRAANEFGVLQGKSLLAIAPTSSGKTFIGELAAARALAAGKKVAVLLPYKALVNEKFDEFQELYGGLGYRVTRSSGDWQDQNDLVFKGQYDIAFFTYETFLNFVLSSPHVLERLGLIVLDEAQFISDGNRGIVVELILTALVAARKRDIAPQLVCLSAVIGDTNRFEDWLGVSLFRDSKRPVPLLEGVLNRTGTYLYQDESGEMQSQQLIARAAIIQRGQRPSSQDVIVPLVHKLAGESNEKVLIFRNTRGSASGSAAYLARDAQIATDTGLSVDISTIDQSARSGELAKCIEKGVAFHTSDLNRDERSFVEKSFRDQDTKVNALVATSTVAAGVNTPASTVVIVETEFYGAGGAVPYSVSHYKNMAGRAGRLGYETSGRSILIADSEHTARQLYDRYVRGEPEAIISSFKDGDLQSWAIKLLAQVSSVQIGELPQLLTSTFAGFTRTIADPSWIERVSSEVPLLIDQFIASGFIEVLDDERVTLTPLGTACGRASFSIGSASKLINLIKRRPELFGGSRNLILSMLTLPEVEERYIPLTRGRDPEANLMSLAHQKISGFPIDVLQSGVREIQDLRRRIKKALILEDWTSGVPISEIEIAYSGNAYSVVRRGDIQGLADAVRFHLGSAAQIIELVSPIEGLEKIVRDALFQLEFGLPIVARPLAEHSNPFSRGEMTRLMQLGVNEVSDATRDVILEQLGEDRSSELFRSPN